MKASLKLMALGLLLLVPFATAQAQAPSLSTIPNVSLNAGATLTVNVVAVDVAGRPITLTASLPSFATLHEPTTGTGVVATTLTLTPTSANVTSYTGAVTATAGGVPDTKTFQIVVNAAGSDQAPVVTAPALHEGTEELILTFGVSASDPDGDAIASLSAPDVPSGATFTPNGSNTSGTFTWTPSAGQAGEYDVLFTASNSLSGSALTHIRVAPVQTLTITPIGDVTVAEGDVVQVPVNVTFKPGAPITLVASLPSFATLIPPTSGTGALSTAITASPQAGSAGTYHASVTATSDASVTPVTENFDFIVTGAGGGGNHPPALIAPATRTVVAGLTLSFDVTATDADGDPVTLSAPGLPPGASFHDNGDNTGTFTWTPTATQLGTFTASFAGDDKRGGIGTASTEVTVTAGTTENHAPTLSAPSTRDVNEGVNLSFDVTASDLDGDHVTLSMSPTPSGATFSDQGNNSGMFSWTPDFTQSGVYDVTFSGDDGHGGIGTAATTITVNDVGGGGGGTAEVPGRACLIGDFKAGSDSTCFRIRPVNGSFDLRDVDLSTIRMEFHGQSIAALPGGAAIEVLCRGVHGGGDDGDDDGGDGHHGDGDDDHGGSGDRHPDKGKDKGHHDGARILLDGDHPRGDDGDDGDDDGDHDCGLSCDDHRQDDHEGECGSGDDHGGECDTLGIRACFSTQALLSLFTGAALPCDLASAEIRATLTSGTTVVATFNGNSHGDEGDKDKDKNKDKDKDKDKNKDQDQIADKGQGGKDTKGLNPKARPNPLNPQTMLSFTMSREGRVRVTVYDMQGRLVKTLLDEVRSAGEQRLSWDGSNARSQKVASGVYFFRIQAPEGDVIHRVAVVK